MNMAEYAASLQSAAGAAEEFLNGTEHKIRFI